jgi:hypothetical protein
MAWCLVKHREDFTFSLYWLLIPVILIPREEYKLGVHECKVHSEVFVRTNKGYEVSLVKVKKVKLSLCFF